MVKVSLGMPVYNGERFVEEAIRSCLDQTLDDFELIICDNASDDRTVELCERAAAGDERVTIHRNSSNIGAAANFNLTVDLATGEYFKWVAHDDMITPDYLEKCARVLDEDPEVVLCHSGVRIVDSDGETIREYDPELEHAGSADVADRFADWAAISHRCLDVFGLIRMDALRKTHVIAPYIASDRSLLAELGLLGTFARVPEVMFLSREHDDRSIRSMPLHQRAAWFDPSNKSTFAFPHFRLWYEYIGLVREAPLTPAERRACYLVLLRWLPIHRRRLAMDLKSAARTAAGIAAATWQRSGEPTDGG